MHGVYSYMLECRGIGINVLYMGCVHTYSVYCVVHEICTYCTCYLYMCPILYVYVYCIFMCVICTDLNACAVHMDCYN